MVQVDVLVLAVPNGYKYHSAGKAVVSDGYENTFGVAETLYGHSTVTLPYRLVLVGY